MLALGRNGYTDAQVKEVLHAENRKLSFRFELYDKVETFKKALTTVLSSSVTYSSLAEIKRRAQFVIQDERDVDYSGDRIKPYARLKMKDGGYAEFPLGIFLLSSPTVYASEGGALVRNVEAYDKTQILLDDKVTSRYTVNAGANYITAVKTLLEGAGITNHSLVATTQTLAAALDWVPGTSKLRIINDLLLAINYLAIWFDEEGRAVAKPYVSPETAAAEYDYKTNSTSVILPGAEREIDFFDVPNKWVLAVSHPELPVLRSEYTNTNAASPTSTVSRGRTILPKEGIRFVEAATQSSLDALASRMAFEDSQVYEKLKFETLIMPFHSHADVYNVDHTSFGVSAKYSELAWSFPLQAGGVMTHDIRRIVSV